MGNSNKLISAIILAVLSLNLAATLGVNAPYWQGTPLKMYPGETREVFFSLVNGVNEPTTEASVSLTKGDDIAEVIGENKYTVNPGENEGGVILGISIPNTAEIGDNYTVGFKVSYIPSGGEGNVKLNVGYDVDFPIEVVSQEDASSTLDVPSTISKSIIYITIAIIVIVLLIGIIILFLKRRNNERKIDAVK